MRRAVRSLAGAVVRRLSLRAASRAAAATALLIASGCLDDAAVSPHDETVGLAISAQVIGGRTVVIEVNYRRTVAGGDGEELARLASTPARVTVQPGTVQQRVTVELTPCLSDPRRVRVGGRDDTCPLVVILRLLDDDDEEIDSERIEPEAPAPGETVTLPTVTLQQPVLVLTPSTLTFVAVEGGALPDDQQVAVTNGGGGSLGELTVTVEGGAAEWLDASLGEDGASVLVQPTTTALEPGQHAATVLVHAAGAGSSPVAVTFDVSPKPTHTLTITGAGSGVGRVTSEPEGIDCTIAAGVASGACSASFGEETLVFLDASPDEGSVFDGWSGACDGEGGCGVTITGARTVEAEFDLERWELTVSAAGNGEGTVTSQPAGIECEIRSGETSGDCADDFAHGTVVELRFSAQEVSVLAGWEGACSGTGICAVTMTGARQVTARAMQLVSIDIGATGDGSGRVTSAPAGIDCAVVAGEVEGQCSEHFLPGVEVTLSAGASAGSEFTGWSGACSGSGSCAIVVEESVAIGAAFELVRHELVVTGAGSGSGSVASTPEGIDCLLAEGSSSGACAAPFLAGTVVTLRATASGSSQFAGWGGACSGTGDCAVTMDQARAVTATFSPPLALTVAGIGDGSGTVGSDPAGIACAITAGDHEGACSAEFEQNSTVVLTADAGPDSEFGGWSGACSGDDPKCLVTMSEARSVTATFTLVRHPLTVAGSGPGSGRVASDPAGIDCTFQSGSPSGSCASPFAHGTSVTLVPSPLANSVFVGWSGACSGTGPTCTVSMVDARTVGVIFDLVSVPLVVNGAGTGSGTVISDVPGIRCTITEGVRSGECSASFPHGTVVTLTPEPASGSTLTGWSGACSGTGDCTVSMTLARSVTATFERVVHKLTIHGGGNGNGTVTSADGAIACVIHLGTVKEGACSAEYAHGTIVELEAEFYYYENEFTGWSGACTGTDSGTCSITMSQDQEVTASFDLEARVIVEGVGDGEGHVKSEPGAIDCAYNSEGGPRVCEDEFAGGTVVTLTATAPEGNIFRGWDGDCENSEPTCTLTVDGQKQVTASFAPTSRFVSVGIFGNGGGSVVSSPAGIDCTGSGGSTDGACFWHFPAESQVVLTATPNASSVFAGWTQGCPAAESVCTLSMNQSHFVSAVFEPKQMLSLSLAGNGSGRVTSSPAGIDCAILNGKPDNPCIAGFTSGTQVTLTALRESGSTHRWDGICKAFGTADTCTITMNQAQYAVAVFERSFTLTVTGSNGGSGRIRSQPGLSPVIDCLYTDGVELGQCAATFDVGTLVELRTEVELGDGSVFGGWSGACSGTTQPCVLPGAIGGPVTVDARFDFDECALLVPLAIPATVSGSIDDDDCRENVGIHRDGYAISPTTQQLFEVVSGSSGMPSELRLRLGDGGFWFSRSSFGGSHRVLAPAGTMIADVLNTTPNDFGSYVLITRATATGGCLSPVIRTTFGVSADFALASGDCSYIASTRPTGAGSPSDRVTIYVPAGRTFKVTVTSTDGKFEPLIELRPGFDDAKWDGALIGTTADHSGGTTASLTRVGGGYMQVWITSRALGGIGPYRITIDPSSSAAIASTESSVDASRSVGSSGPSTSVLSGGGGGSSTLLPPH